MTTARRALTSWVVNDKIYCIWGYTWSNTDKNEEYAPLWTASWELTTDFTWLPVWTTSTSSKLLLSKNTL
jgi:hypothetical protein